MDRLSWPDLIKIINMKHETKLVSLVSSQSDTVSHFLNSTPPPERIDSAENDEEMVFVILLAARHNATAQCDLGGLQ